MLIEATYTFKSVILVLLCGTVRVTLEYDPYDCKYVENAIIQNPENEFSFSQTMPIN